jgi:uncharacterized membrane protein YfcA
MNSTLAESAALGAIVGLILALTGAGGGILAVPLLVFGLGLPMAKAGPIGLLAVGLAAAVGAALGLREGIVRYRAAMMIGALGIATAPVGLWFAARVPNAPLMIAFALVLAWVGLRMIRQGGAALAGRAPPVDRDALPCVLAADGRLRWTFPCARALAGTGIVSGLLSGLLGVGGGFVIVPALNRYTDLTMQSVVATSLAVITLVSLGGAASATASGALDWGLALPFGGGAVLGLLLGRQVSEHVAGPRLQQAFGAVSAVVALSLLVRGAMLLAAAGT